MDIEQRKLNFVAFLRNAFQTGSSEEVYLTDSVLEENSFTGATFWEVICPALIKEALLTHFSNPDDFASDFNESLSLDSEYSSAVEALYAPIINIGADFYSPEKYSLLDSNLTNMKARLRKIYRHKFIVNKGKLMESSARLRLHFSKQIGITDDVGHKYPIAGKRAELVEKLWELKLDEALPGPDLQDVFSKNSSDLSKDVMAINKVFCNKFNVRDDLIENGGQGYFLNRKNYDLQPLIKRL